MATVHSIAGLIAWVRQDEWREEFYTCSIATSVPLVAVLVSTSMAIETLSVIAASRT
jgi:hypothetical protein